MASGGATSDQKREIMVQHILVKEEDEKVLTDLQKRILMNGEDLGALATEYSVCPSKKDGGMLGWIKKGMLVPEFEEAAFAAKLNRPVKVKTKFGWHLLQVLSEREANEVIPMAPEDFQARLKDGLPDDVQLMDVREPHEVEKSSLPGFKVYPLSKFGEWAPALDLDPKKETIVMCHHGMRSLQAATWLVQQGFKDVKNLTGGIDYYSKTVDPTVPQY
ncbi:hypothetical protein KFL_004370090 [Klebsormidium nitens]|uniref:Peptidyl-prolyl cis-trans isomerase n=1 Tax=Klebsormidium nitens TaxID=105231 RepID=A0A1Y1IGA8_KLENI|nr:hypothetical protein KFL_004370090 [Klebsormidium nitens]|eukprot:GAQ88539.1 hypothetical protein KFL_004370090 [Klebsormidium nitens]